MQHILVPILTPEDVAAIPRTVEHIKSVTPLAVVILTNPSLGITPAEATAKIDKEMSDLESSKAQAVSREDYEGAAQFRKLIEDKKMERQDALRNGWKSVPLENRMKSYDQFVQPFVAPWHVRHIVLQEDAGYDNLLNTLATMSSNWPDCLPKGRYAILHPRSVGPIKATPQPAQAVQTEKKVETAPKAQKAPSKLVTSETPLPVAQVTRESRKAELLRWYMKMKNAAQTHGIEISGVPKERVVEQILDKEFAVTA